MGEGYWANLCRYSLEVMKVLIISASIWLPPETITVIVFADANHCRNNKQLKTASVLANRAKRLS